MSIENISAFISPDTSPRKYQFPERVHLSISPHELCIMKLGQEGLASGLFCRLGKETKE